MNVRIARGLPTVFVLAALAMALVSASALAAPNLAVAPVGGYEQVPPSRVVGRTVTEFTYRVVATNSGGAARDVVGTVSSRNPATTIVDGVASFGTVGVGATVRSSDTIVIRHDRRFPFDPAALVWTFAANANAIPVADAGPDLAVFINDVVDLDGSGTIDGNGDALTYFWSFDVRPPGSTATLVRPDAPRPQFTADAEGDYVVRLTVTDGLEADSDTVIVRTFPRNVAPVAVAGPDVAARVGGTVRLDGTGSTDANGDLLSYAWAFVSRPEGSTASLAAAGTAQPSFVVDRPGAYVVRLVVSDGSLASPDDVVVTTENTPPVAQAGPDLRVVRGQQVTLDGSGSADADGDALSYLWSLIARPDRSGATLSGATQAMPNFVADRSGDYVAQLIVNDGRVDGAADTVLITTTNARPVARPGTNRSVDVGVDVTLDGNASTDPEGGGLIYSWSLVARPPESQATLTNALTPTPSFTADRAGTYTVQLVVDDGELASEPATVDVVAVAVATEPVFRVRLSDNTRSEGTSPTSQGFAIFVVERVSGSTAESIISASLAGSGARPADANDLDLGAAYVTRLAEGEVSAIMARVSFTADARIEPDETFSLRLTSTSVGTIDPVGATAEAVIRNDDGADLSLALARTNGSGPIRAGDTATFLVTVANAGVEGTDGTLRFGGPPGTTIERVGLLSGDPVGYDPVRNVHAFPIVDPVTSVVLEVTVRFGVGAVGNGNLTAEIATAAIPDPDSTPGNFDTDPAVEDDAAAVGVEVRGLSADLGLTFERFGAADPVKVGETTSFRVTVANDGPDAGGGTVQLTLPLDVTLNSVGLVGLGAPVVFDFDTATWTLPALGAGQSATLAIEVLAGAGAVGSNNNIVAEVATATAFDPDSTPGNLLTEPNVEDDAASAGFAVIPLRADLRLALERLGAGGELPPDGVATFRVSVANDGPDRGDGTARFGFFGNAAVVSVAAEGGAPPPAFVVDTVTGNGVWDFSALAAGATDSVLVTLDFDGVGSFFVEAEILTATVGDPDSTPGNGTANPEDDEATLFVTVREPAADLSVSAPVAGITGTQGGTGTVTYVVTNGGPEAGGGSFGLVFNFFPVIDVVTNAGSVDANRVWTLPVLAPGASASITYTLRLNDAGNGNIVGEILSATARDPDSTPGNFNTEPTPEDDAATVNFAVVAGGADLSLTASVTDTTVRLGEEREITFTVSNGGPLAGGGTLVVGEVDAFGQIQTVFTYALPEIQPGQSVSFPTTMVFGTVGPRTITGEIATATQPDQDSTPGNLATAPDEDDGLAINFTTRDDGLPPVFALRPATGPDALITEGTTSQFPLGVVIERTGSTAQAATVTYFVFPTLTGNRADDRDLVGGTRTYTVEFAPGQREARVLVYTVADIAPEGSETFRVGLSATTVGTVTSAETVYTIQDDDLPLGQSFYFSGLSPGRGRELWGFSPREGGPPDSDPVARPVVTTEWVPGPGSSDPRDIHSVGETVIFRALDDQGNSRWLAHRNGQSVDIFGAGSSQDFDADFDAQLPLEQRTLAVQSDDYLWLAGPSVLPGIDYGIDVLYGFNEANGGALAAARALDGTDRRDLTALPGGVGYIARDGSGEEQVYIVLETWDASFISVGTPITELSGWTLTGDLAAFRPRGPASPPPEPYFGIRGDVSVFFTGTGFDSFGTEQPEALWRVNVRGDESTWSPPGLGTGEPEFVDVNGTAGGVPLAPEALTFAATGAGERIFFFGRAQDGNGDVAEALYALAEDASGVLSWQAASGLSLVDGLDITPWAGGVLVSGQRDPAGSGAATPFVATWTDADGNGAFTLTVLTEGMFRTGSLAYPSAGVVEHLVTDGQGRAAWVVDTGDRDSLWVFDGTETYGFLERFGEIDELQLGGGKLVYRQEAFGGAGFQTLFVHDIASSSGRPIITGEPLGAGTADGVVGGPTLVATDFGVAFQASSAAQFGTRLWTAARGALAGEVNLFTVQPTAERNLGTGLPFDGGWIGTGFRHDTAENGLFRADETGLTTLSAGSTNFSAAVAGLGTRIVFGETSDVVNDVLVHDLASGNTTTLLAGHVIGSAGTVGSRIVFSAISDALVRDGNRTNDVWSLYSYTGGTTATKLVDLPRGASSTGELLDDPIVPWSTEAVSFLGDDSRIYWKQRNEETAGDIGVELHGFAFATSALTVLDVGAGAISGSDFNDAVVANGKLYFLGSSDGSFGERRVQVTDGTNLLTPVTGPDLRAPFGAPNNLLELDGEVFFTSIDDRTGFQRIFQLDDSGSTATRLALPGIPGVPVELAALGSDIGVIAFSTGVPQVFRFTPGAQPGSESAATQLTFFSASADTGSLTRGGDGEIYFTRTEAASGRELWVLDDLVPGGVRLVQDINLEPAPASYFPEQVVAVPRPGP